MGFFSVRSGVPEDGSLERTVEIERTTPAGRVKAKATIAVHKQTGGFPGVEEQDVYYAILSAVGEAMAIGEEIRMPLRFAPGELLRRMGKEPGGPNYKALGKQLKRLAGATIVSERAIYRAETDEWVSSTDELFRVIDRVILKDERAPDGSVATEHYIWLSSWQLENLRARHRLLVDYQRYLKLHKPIAKAIAPYLQIWLYASRHQGKFERLYEPLCKLLNIKVEPNPASIRKQLTAPFKELAEAGYIKSWAIEKAGGVFTKRFKIVFVHGPAFKDHPDLPYDDLESVDDLGGSQTLSADETRFYVQRLQEHGIWASEARKLARNLTREEWVRALRIIDYVDTQIDAREVQNKAGLLADLLRSDRREPITLKPVGARARAKDVPVTGTFPELEQQATEDAEAALAEFKRVEAETDEIIRSMAASEKAELYEMALEAVERTYPGSQQWAPQVRERQREVYFRSLVRERYGV